MTSTTLYILLGVALFALLALAPVIYSDRLVPAGAAGCARGPLVFIRPTSWNDAGLLAHERVHVRQWWRTLGLHSILYLISHHYRLNAEVRAYREQAKHYPDDRRMVFAQFIAEKYGLSVTVLQAYALLK